MHSVRIAASGTHVGSNSTFLVLAAALVLVGDLRLNDSAADRSFLVGEGEGLQKMC